MTNLQFSPVSGNQNSLKSELSQAFGISVESLTDEVLVGIRKIVSETQVIITQRLEEANATRSWAKLTRAKSQSPFLIEEENELENILSAVGIPSPHDEFGRNIILRAAKVIRSRTRYLISNPDSLHRQEKWSDFDVINEQDRKRLTKVGNFIARWCK